MSKDYTRHTVACKKYEKTRRGKLVRTYRNMLSRVKGIQKKKAHLYQGLALLDKHTFYAWSLLDPDYNIIFDTWVKSNYARTLSPSVDRIDPSEGYVKGNIRWITHSQNSRLGSLNRQWS